MNLHYLKRIKWNFIILIYIFFTITLAYSESVIPLIKKAGIKGGLIVHAGCGEGKLCAELKINNSFIVYGLDINPDNINKARKYIQSKGLYGQVSINLYNGKNLPFENMVNLLIIEEPEKITKDEIMKALVPEGVALIKEKNGEWKKIIKPWPKKMDEWTHWLYGPDGNAVSKDRIAGPPRRLQWTAEPLWARSHHSVPSISAMVSSAGRFFYILDEGPMSLGGEKGDKWMLICRDAFNGVLLWKQPMKNWGWEAWSANWHGRFNQPHQLPKHLIAIKDKVYITPAYNGPLVQLDAATGKTLKIYEGTEGADEIIYKEGIIFLTCNILPEKDSQSDNNQASGHKKKKLPAPPKKIILLNAETGEKLWEKRNLTGLQNYSSSGRLDLVVGNDSLFFIDKDIISLDIQTGKEILRIPRPEPGNKEKKSAKISERGILVFSDNVLLFAQLDGEDLGYHSYPATLYAYSAKDGTLLWKHPIAGWPHHLPPDVFVIKGLVWVHEHMDTKLGSLADKKIRSAAHKRPVNQEKLPYSISGLDLKTGKLKKSIPTHQIFNIGHHHRCYRGNATERYIMTARRGIEYTDIDTGIIDSNHWVRSGCLFGSITCNGLLYTGPHGCDCYINAQLKGIFALAPSSEKATTAHPDIPPEKPVEVFIKGSDYNKKVSSGKENDDWPTYRHDIRRSGSTQSPVSLELKTLWTKKFSHEPSPVVAVGGMIYTAIKDEHYISALDAQTGKEKWSFFTGARIDSPPTIAQGMTVFGSQDGWIYCLNASHGQLVWKRRLALGNKLVGAFGQMESAWPVPGSVLVKDNTVYASAGRSSFLDHGIMVYTLDLKTGNIVKQERLYSLDPKTGKMFPEMLKDDGRGDVLSASLRDILKYDQDSIYMGQTKIFEKSQPSAKSKNILNPKVSFLDGTWASRTGWGFGKANYSQLMVFDDDRTYGIRAYKPGKGTFFTPGKDKYKLFAAEKGKNKNIWEKEVPIRFRAMVLAGDKIFAIGPPDIVDPDDPLAAFEGRLGSILCVYSIADGKKLKEYKMDSMPAWNGIAAANKKLFISFIDGKVICME